MADCILSGAWGGTSTGTIGPWNGLGRLPPTVQRQDIHIVSSNFNSATAKLQYSIDGDVTWVDVPADKDANLVSLTASGIMTVKQRWARLKVVWSGGTPTAGTYVVT